MSDYSLGVSYSTELPTGIYALSASIFDSCPRFNLGNWAFRQLSVSIRAIGHSDCPRQFGQLGIPIVRLSQLTRTIGHLLYSYNYYIPTIH